MGKIIIDLPLKINRRYLLNDVESAALLLQGLEASAIRVEENPAATAEDLADASSAGRARKGDLIAWEDVKKQLGLM